MKILDVKVYLGANPSTCSMRVARALLVHARETWWNSSQRVRRGNRGNGARAASWGTHARFIEHDATAHRGGDTGGRRVAGASAGNASVRVLQGRRSRCNPMT